MPGAVLGEDRGGAARGCQQDGHGRYADGVARGAAWMSHMDASSVGGTAPCRAARFAACGRVPV